MGNLPSRDEYYKAEPFPHCVIDNFMDANELREAITRDWPKENDSRWLNKGYGEVTSYPTSIKSSMSDETGFGPKIKKIIRRLNSAEFLIPLADMLGFFPIPDPYLEGGGLHWIKQGGYLDVHVDYNYHKFLGLDRRVNLLLYLNENWKDEWFGNLELWKNPRKRIKCIKPIFNRCVIFNTTEESWHGHPVPLNTPPDIGRKSIALYYYTKGRPESEVRDFHSTIYTVGTDKADLIHPDLRKSAIRKTRKAMFKLMKEGKYE